MKQPLQSIEKQFKRMQASLRRLEERNRSFAPHQRSDLAQNPSHVRSSGNHRNVHPNQRQNSAYSYNRTTRKQGLIFKPDACTASGVPIWQNCGKRGHISPNCFQNSNFSHPNFRNLNWPLPRRWRSYRIFHPESFFVIHFILILLLFRVMIIFTIFGFIHSQPLHFLVDTGESITAISSVNMA